MTYDDIRRHPSKGREMRADIIAEKVIKGIHSQGWRVIGIGGSLTKAMRPLQEYIKRKVERAVKAERERAEKAEAELAALRERLAQEPVATPSRSFEDVYKVQTERLATERERADKAEQNYRLMIKNHVPRNIFDWNTRK